MKITILTAANHFPIIYEKVSRCWINEDIGKASIKFASGKELLATLPGEVCSIEATAPSGKSIMFSSDSELDILGQGSTIQIEEE